MHLIALKILCDLRKERESLKQAGIDSKRIVVESTGSRTTLQIAKEFLMPEPNSFLTEGERWSIARYARTWEKRIESRWSTNPVSSAAKYSANVMGQASELLSDFGGGRATQIISSVISKEPTDLAKNSRIMIRVSTMLRTTSGSGYWKRCAGS